MTLEDLQAAGVVLPKEEWGERDLSTTASKTGTIATGVIALAACAMMYLGGGAIPTWIGAALFLLDLFVFIWLAIRAVEIQAERYPHRPPSTRGGATEHGGDR